MHVVWSQLLLKANHRHPRAFVCSRASSSSGCGRKGAFTCKRLHGTEEIEGQDRGRMLFCKPILRVCDVPICVTQMVPGSSGAWLKTDLRELCPINSNPASFAWALIFTFVYLIGVPALFLSVLTFFKVPKLARAKIKMHKFKAVLKEIGQLKSDQFTNWDGTGAAINLLSSSQCKQVLEHQFQARARFECGGACVVNAMVDSGFCGDSRRRDCWNWWHRWQLVCWWAALCSCETCGHTM